MREIAGRDREVVTTERAREPAPDEAVGAVGANQEARAKGGVCGVDPRAARLEPTSVTRAAVSVAPARHAAASSAASNVARLATISDRSRSRGIPPGIRL